MQQQDAPKGLALRLREGTAEAHKHAERAAFIKRFFQGQLKRDEYAAFLSALYPVYAAMEAALGALREHPVVGPFFMPEMFRCRELAGDIRYFAGPDWRPEQVTGEGSRAFAARVTEVAESAPPLLLAHVYTRYLGDLSGGQLMGKTAQKSLGLDSDEGLSFYRFTDIADVDGFKNAFRAKLDAAPLSREDQDRVVAEARLSFELNHRMTSDVTLAA